MYFSHCNHSIYALSEVVAKWMAREFKILWINCGGLLETGVQ